MGTLAVQDMKGVSMMVSRRSRVLGNVRLAITAGTLQPKPTIRGTMLRPLRPMRRRAPSVTKAMRAM